MNLWSMDLVGGGLKQHTFHKEFDASEPSLSDGRIVYQLVSDIHAVIKDNKNLNPRFRSGGKTE